MPSGDETEMARFLVWLLAENGDHFTTSSSDVAGVATCLSSLGFTVLSVCVLETEMAETHCKLQYSPLPFLHDMSDRLTAGYGRLQRGQSTTVALTQLDEAFTAFPIDYRTANDCRSAWRAGFGASKYVRLELHIPDR